MDRLQIIVVAKHIFIYVSQLFISRMPKMREIPQLVSAPLNLIPIGHFTVIDGSEVDGDLVLIQTLLLYYVNQVILMLPSSFQEQFP